MRGGQTRRWRSHGGRDPCRRRFTDARCVIERAEETILEGLRHGLHRVGALVDPRVDGALSTGISEVWKVTEQIIADLTSGPADTAEGSKGRRTPPPLARRPVGHAFHSRHCARVLRKFSTGLPERPPVTGARLAS